MNVATMEASDKRRPIKVRNTRWATAIARRLTQLGLTPNQISVLSMVFSVIGAGTLVLALHPAASAFTWALYLATAACIQLRLLCNLFDGMVAVEGGKKSKSGEIFNELPDRISDTVLLVAAGYCATPGSASLGWAAAALAILTAYVRTLGTQAGAPAQFCGPMAKQQRMFILTFACVIVAFIDDWMIQRVVLYGALGLIIAGCLITFVRRTWRIIRALEAGRPSN